MQGHAGKKKKRRAKKASAAGGSSAGAGQAAGQGSNHWQGSKAGKAAAAGVGSPCWHQAYDAASGFYYYYNTALQVMHTRASRFGIAQHCSRTSGIHNCIEPSAAMHCSAYSRRPGDENLEDSAAEVAVIVEHTYSLVLYVLLDMPVSETQVASQLLAGLAVRLGCYLWLLSFKSSRRQWPCNI